MKSAAKKQFPETIKKATLKLSLPQHLQEIQEWMNKQASFRGFTGKKNGNVALLYGSQKTGKQTIATLLANQAGKELHQVDFTKLVSKYMGETEKNISELFTLAETKGWILFIDEADAIFGKRTQVKDAHDRYANVEVSYLIEKIEAYNGLIILSTNRKSNIDPGFLRRLQTIIHFPSP
jgi:SpoVK/Ycf46/Vps4 family AAA+-type ATPase